MEIKKSKTFETGVITTYARISVISFDLATTKGVVTLQWYLNEGAFKSGKTVVCVESQQFDMVDVGLLAKLNDFVNFNVMKGLTL